LEETKLCVQHRAQACCLASWKREKPRWHQEGSSESNKKQATFSQDAAGHHGYGFCILCRAQDYIPPFSKKGLQVGYTNYSDNGDKRISKGDSK
jgi:hypothetical protein